MCRPVPLPARSQPRPPLQITSLWPSPYVWGNGSCISVSTQGFNGTGYGVMVGVYSSAYSPNGNPMNNLIARSGSAYYPGNISIVALQFTSPGTPLWLVFNDAVDSGEWAIGRVNVCT